MTSIEVRGEMNVEAQEIPTYKPWTMEVFITRHGQKKGKAETLAEDRLIALTEAGEEEALASGADLEANSMYATAKGSPRLRSRQLSGLQVMHRLGKEEAMEFVNTELERLERQGAMTREEIEQTGHYSSRPLKVGGTDKRLDFSFSPGNEHNKTINPSYYDHYNNKKDALEFLYHESDDVIRQSKDTDSDCYTRFVGKFAEIAQEYLQTYKNIDKLFHNKLANFEQLTNEEQQEIREWQDSGSKVQRFLGTHQTALEPLLIEVIKSQEFKTGVNAEDRVQDFFAALKQEYNDTNGFGTAKGYKLEITKPDEQSEPVMTLDWEGQRFLVTKEMLTGMVQNMNEFNKEIAQLAKK